jgi:hypothetical protein
MITAQSSRGEGKVKGESHGCHGKRERLTSRHLSLEKEDSSGIILK